ncbi:aspartic peptidase domain-containing protein [Gaertneriomyces semiglobifer]|nr:aspartic peptidase domain-containing protein [Gaertneriomyces semiglobifer]
MHLCTRQTLNSSVAVACALLASICIDFVGTAEARNLVSLTGQSGPDLRPDLSGRVTLKTTTPGNGTAGRATVKAGSFSHTLVAKIGVGTPPQELSVQIDSGSSLFWVRSPVCEGCAGEGAQGAYDSGKSETYVAIEDDKRTITYGDNTHVECKLARDSVTVGDFIVHQQTLCEADVVDSNAGYTDGLIGLGPPTAGSATDIIRSMVNEKLIAEPLVSFWYAQNAEFNGDNAGEITFGGIDPSRYVGDMHWFPVLADAPRHWSVPLDYVMVDGTVMRHQRGRAVFDTGTTQVLLPPRSFHEIVRRFGFVQLESQPNLYTISCENAANLPPVSFSIGANRTLFTLSGEQHVFKADVGGRKTECLLIYAPSFASLNVDAIFGALFLRNFYTVFDYQNVRTGLAVAAHDSFISSGRKLIYSSTFLGVWGLSLALAYLL